MMLCLVVSLLRSKFALCKRQDVLRNGSKATSGTSRGAIKHANIQNKAKKAQERLHHKGPYDVVPCGTSWDAIKPANIQNKAQTKAEKRGVLWPLFYAPSLHFVSVRMFCKTVQRLHLVHLGAPSSLQASKIKQKPKPTCHGVFCALQV